MDEVGGGGGPIYRLVFYIFFLLLQVEFFLPKNNLFHDFLEFLIFFSNYFNGKVIISLELKMVNPDQNNSQKCGENIRFIHCIMVWTNLEKFHDVVCLMFCKHSR